MMMALIRIIGSFGCTAVISAVLIILLIVATLMEAVHGTSFAQKAFYHARWFDIVLSFLWINIFCSTILRFPFNKNHVGFLITHGGILLILAGALMARIQGVDGEIIVFEGETGNSITRPVYALGAGFPNQEEISFELREGSFRLDLTKGRMGAAVPSPSRAVDFNIVKVMDYAPDTDLAAALAVPSISTKDVYRVSGDRWIPVHFPEGDVFFTLMPQQTTLPFSLTLKQFRKIDYPGTREAAGYESDVLLRDTARQLTLERTIAVNHPLAYDGYRIFQSSYLNDPQKGKGSVFTVAKNPGIPWIYAGSILACAGALFQFYGPGQKKAA
ncbi:MAG: cytochrome c biogenesis protein ResB [Candidatus Omnitrophota bacterium]